MTETVARTKARREAVVGASRKRVALCEDHSRVAELNLSKPCRIAALRHKRCEAVLRNFGWYRAICAPMVFDRRGFLFSCAEHISICRKTKYRSPKVNIESSKG